MAALLQPVPERADFAARGKKLAVAEVIDPSDLAEWLVASGYKRVEAVEYPGEFGRRGGIVDVYPPDATDPVRLEFFGDELESIRTFATASQRSLNKLPAVTLLAVSDGSALRSTDPASRVHGDRGFLTDYLPPQSWVALVEPSDLKEQAKLFFERVSDATGLFTAEGAFANLMRLPNVVMSALPRASVEATAHLRVESVERFSGSVHRVRDELDAVASDGTARVMIACQSEAECHRLTDVMKAGRLSESHRLQLVTGHVRAGFRLVDAGVVVLGSHELFHKDVLPPGVKAAPVAGSSRRVESRAIDTFLSLNDGDYVVHIAHGIARFRGMKMLAKASGGGDAPGDVEDEEPGGLRPPLAGAQEEHLVLEFRGGSLLYVPASRIDLVQKYIGGSHMPVRRTEQARRHVVGAQEGQGLRGGPRHGRRDDPDPSGAGHPARLRLPADSDWQREFEDAVPVSGNTGPTLEQHPGDQRRPGEAPKPMDRLLCGDVGYGKTEVAVRAAFKAIDNGKQVAILVPTTVLAEQHFRTFRSAFAEYPFTVGVPQPLQARPRQQKEIDQEGRPKAAIDVVVGTHRLVSEGREVQGSRAGHH